MRHAVIAAIALGALLTGRTAFANPSDADEPPARMMSPAIDPDPTPMFTRIPEMPASEGAATALAVTTTVAGLAGVAIGVKLDVAGAGLLGGALAIIGPSMGHLYAGSYAHALGTTALRTAGAVVFLAGLIQSSSTYQVSDGGGGHRGDGTNAMAIGAITFVATTVYDLYDAHRAVARANRDQRRVIVTPTIGASGGVGLAVGGAF